MNKALRSLSELFVEGIEVPVPGGHYIWLQKLNPFQRDEATMRARAARARVMEAARTEGSDELTVFNNSIAGLDHGGLVSALVNQLANTYRYDAVLQLRADDEWAERLQVMNTEADVAQRDPDDPERKLIDRYNVEFTEAVQSIVNDRSQQEKSDLQMLGNEELRRRCAESYLERLGLEAFNIAYAKHELRFGTRVCVATDARESGAVDHTDCDHSQTLFTGVHEVEQIGDGLYVLLRGGFEELAMDRADARFSGGQGSSSESSPLPEQEEESPASTPEATSGELAGTSA